MPSALETLVKILKLEREQGYKNTAVIGGLGAFAENWQRDAHAQARRPEHHVLVDELAGLMREYETLTDRQARHNSVKYMLGRITGRIPAPAGASVVTEEAPTVPEQPPPPPAREKPREPRRTAPPREKPRRRKPVESLPPDRERPRPGVEEAPSAGQPVSHPKPRRKPRPELDVEEAAERLHGLESPVTVVERVGERMAERLARLGIHTVQDLLYHLPRRYDDYTRLLPINKVRPGETTTLIGTVRQSDVLKGRGGREFLRVIMDDGTGSLQVAFFGQAYLRNQLKRGTQLVVSGKVDLYLGKPAMTNPEWELLEYDNLHTRAIVPVYPLTKGISARTMRRIMKSTVDYWSPRLPDYMPESVLDRAGLVDLGWALRQVHFPENWDYLHYARERLAFDELFLIQMAMLARRRAWQKVPAVPQPVSDDWLEAALERLPFSLTGAQRRALDAIRADMAGDIPMNRLLQGDVGSGKTVVAALAMGIAVQNGGQAALMAPTGILAEQHYRSLSRLLAELPLEKDVVVRLLTGATPPAEREAVLQGLTDGSVHVVIGTHALIQSGVEFANLTLAIIDEQHRFGVAQRGALRSKGTNPHLLVMTATPIPRTLALTLHADLDLTIIDEMPPGRTPVETHLLTERERERAYSFIDSQIEKGRQAFIVYPLVEGDGDEDSEAQAAVTEYERLSRDIFPRWRLGLLHGRLPSDEKEAVMAAFQAGEIDILVSTSVVEVGIDVPNATVILIEGANRFGLAQLHQFRGRVGRGEHPSYCLLIGETETEDARKRLEAMVRTTDGFELAEIDFKLRGAGDLLGTRQSGLSGRLRFGGDMYPPLVALAQREARTLYEEDPDLSLPEHRLLAERVGMWQTKETDLS